MIDQASVHKTYDKQCLPVKFAPFGRLVSEAGGLTGENKWSFWTGWRAFEMGVSLVRSPNRAWTSGWMAAEAHWKKG